MLIIVKYKSIFFFVKKLIFIIYIMSLVGKILDKMLFSLENLLDNYISSIIDKHLEERFLDMQAKNNRDMAEIALTSFSKALNNPSNNILLSQSYNDALDYVNKNKSPEAYIHFKKAALLFLLGNIDNIKNIINSDNDDDSFKNNIGYLREYNL